MSFQTVAELKKAPEGSFQDFETVLLFKKANSRTARNGSEFLMVDLADRSGSFSVTCFSNTPSFDFFKSATEGAVVKVEGQTDHYQGRFSPKLVQVSIVEEAEMEPDMLNNLIESSLEDPQKLWEEVFELIEGIKHEPLRETVRSVVEEHEESFKVCPGAISMHHAYCHGLMEHTVHVARAAKALLPLYPEVNPDLAIAGIILHDMGKALEYENYKSVRKSRIGILQGHVVLGYKMARKAAIQNKLEEHLVERLEHIILSHQGELEWGAATKAATPEAVFVSMVDNLDAKMGMVQYALRTTPEENEFSDMFPGLGSKVLVTPVH